MNIYVLDSVSDNPLYEGLVLWERAELLDTWPVDWRANYQTWQPRSLKSTWLTPSVEGNVRRFNDYPCINMLRPAFSQRAVDLLRDLLEPNGELLPVKHELGTYYFFNCTHMSNCVDLTKSKTTKLKDGTITSTERLIFIEELAEDLMIFKVRTQLIEIFCTQRFVDRVNAAGLQGLVFIPIWPLAEGVTYQNERHRVQKLSEKWKPKDTTELEIKGNTVVLRLYCERWKPTKKDISTAEGIISHLEKLLYNADQEEPGSYFGNFEDYEVVDFEIRVFLSTPDCDRLVEYLKPSLQSLPWPGKFHVVMRRGEFVDDSAEEEYVRLWA